MQHNVLPQVVLMVLSATFFTLWWGAIATGVPWNDAAPFLILAGVFLAAMLVLWGIRTAIEPPETMHDDVGP